MKLQVVNPVWDNSFLNFFFLFWLEFEHTLDLTIFWNVIYKYIYVCVWVCVIFNINNSLAEASKMSYKDHINYSKTNFLLSTLHLVFLLDIY